MTTRAIPYCDIHEEAFVDTNPADPENGPSPDDCDNELICFSCESELANAESSCIAHRKPFMECLPCLYETAEDV